ncbi:hypothetical protein GA0115233_101235 [Streptomyces sp. DI166]|uniref:FDLD family class I lanthipeptide n=1 Tax=unclassified Streptomyces TaxID=2593676 RepID=UPI0007F48AAC|nr:MULTISPECIES: FDLD family class I lanthipeptide [unclassified Streptomyces]SBT89781.1 hypothetical protein GA0115233_101235 [Streptomyces sp. DI166]
MAGNEFDLDVRVTSPSAGAVDQPMSISSLLTRSLCTRVTCRGTCTCVCTTNCTAGCVQQP